MAHDAQDYRHQVRLDNAQGYRRRQVRLDKRALPSVRGFIANHIAGYIGAGPGYYAQATEDDAYRRDALATLRIALMSSGHPDHRWLFDRTGNRTVRAVRGKD
jgi:hypothetical protein